jgi:hypothetical protein
MQHERFTEGAIYTSTVRPREDGVCRMRPLPVREVWEVAHEGPGRDNIHGLRRVLGIMSDNEQVPPVCGAAG